MNKKMIAVIAEIVPVVSAAAFFVLMYTDLGSQDTMVANTIAMALAVLGFVFFIAGRKLDREDKLARVLGIMDILATVSIVGFYVLAFFSVGM